MNLDNLFVGTSGWIYSHWDNVFYPKNVKDKLDFYCSKLRALEVNASFYRIPKPEVFKVWGQKTPDNFKLVLKAPRSVTHTRKLILWNGEHNEGIQRLRYFIDGVKQIPKHKLGPVLVQIPPKFNINLPRLIEFLTEMSRNGLAVAFEIRNLTWVTDSLFDALNSFRAALVASDFRSCITQIHDTGNFVYVRRHGTTVTYGGSYSDDMIMEDLGLIEQYTHQKPVYVFYNNDDRGYAAMNAMRMMELARKF